MLTSERWYTLMAFVYLFVMLSDDMLSGAVKKDLH